MAAFIVLIIYSFGLLTFGVYIVKFLDQRARDRQRVTFGVNFPSDLEYAAVLAWIRALSGAMRPRAIRLIGAPTIVFEMVATHTGIVHELKVPWSQADYIVQQLHSLVPGISLEELPMRPDHTDWTRAVELALTSASRQLRVFSPVDTSASLLASV